MSAHEAQINSAAHGHWDEPEEIGYACMVISTKGQDDPVHRCYRLQSLDSFATACLCSWVSPERDMFDEMIRDFDRHLDEVRQAGTAPA